MQAELFVITETMFPLIPNIGHESQHLSFVSEMTDDL